MSRFVVAFVMVLAVATAPARAQVGAWCDGDPGISVLDGMIDPGEYSGSSTGIGNGFGSMIGDGVEMYFDSDASGNLAMAIDATGGTCAWGADDTVVVYVDSIPMLGFADTTGLTDTADAGRAAASGMGTDLSRAALTFAPGFTADHALVLRGDSVSLFRLRAGEPHLFVRGLMRAPEVGFDTACEREIAGFSMRDLGSQRGNPLRWMATVINASNGFRSNELQGAAAAPAANIGAAAHALAPGDRNTFESNGPPVGLAGSFAWIDFGTFDGSGFAPAPTCGQLSSESWAVAGFSDGALAFGGTQTTPATDYTRGVPPGASVSTGGIYAFNVAPNDRGLGVQPAGGDFIPGSFTVRVENTSTSTIGDAVVSYRFLFRNDSARASSLSVDWSVDGTTFTPEAALTFTTPLAADSTPVGWTSTSLATTLTGLAIPPGGMLFVRFSGADAGGTGGRDEIALDDVVIAPTYGACGDGAVEGGESCDAGAANGTTPCGCQTDCSFGASGTACGGGGLGGCDMPDTCDGVGACADRVIVAGTECRASSGGACDAPEACDGTSPACPADRVRAAGTVCAPADPGDPCDANDVCDGVSATCLIDASAPDGTPCGDALGCNGAETCMAGVCGNAPDVDCDDDDLCTSDACAEPGTCSSSPIAGCCNVSADCSDGNACTAETCSGPGGTCSSSPIASCCNASADCDDGDACTTETCSGPGGTCSSAPIAGCCNASADCDDGDACTVETCSGPGGTCSSSAITGCCAEDSDCADASACTADSCDPTTERCVFSPIPSCCAGAADCDDGNICTADACDGAGSCAITPIEGCCQSDADCDDANACTSDSCGADDTCVNDAIASCCAVDADCDDGDACTDDACVAGSCEATPVCADGGLPDDGGVSPDAGESPDGGNVGVDAGLDGGSGTVTTDPCGCRAVGRSGAPPWPALIGLALWWFARRRRAERHM